MQRFKRQRTRKMAHLPEVSLTPLIDTLLVLLVIFMVTTPIMHNAIKIELPQGKSHDTGKTPQELVVAFDARNNLYLNDKPCTEQQLLSAIASSIHVTAGRTVFIQADGRNVWAKVGALVSKIRGIPGVRCVAMALQKESGS